MVKVAVAGGSGEVAREIIDALIASDNHEIVLLSRKDVSELSAMPRSTWVRTDYSDKERLIESLRGVHTVLSFVTPQTDPGNEAQKSLIDASIAAGVKRFAPSEWATSSFEHMPWYAGKAEIRKYLQEVNKNEMVLEYSLFQPGLFLNYLTHPHKSAKHVNTFQTQFDFENRRAIVPEGCDDIKLTLTTAQDLANVVVKAVEHEGKWPINGGIKGCDLTVSQIIQLGQEVRDGPFTVEKLKLDDLKEGTLKSSWMPIVSHPAISPGKAKALANMLLCGMTLGISAGALNVSNEWNRLLPDYQFTQPRQFLSEAWRDKP